MKLIIAEKPSLARNIVAGIGEMSKRNGFFENKEYIVTWAFGHLFSLCDIEDYQGKNGEKVRWSMEGLPCFPPDFRFKLKLGEDKKPDAGVEKQFALIKTLCGRNDVDTIINAGDADREGEIIVRLCVEATGVILLSRRIEPGPIRKKSHTVPVLLWIRCFCLPKSVTAFLWS